jgi:hypothetical protein
MNTTGFVEPIAVAASPNVGMYFLDYKTIVPIIDLSQVYVSGFSAPFCNILLQGFRDNLPKKIPDLLPISF